MEAQDFRVNNLVRYTNYEKIKEKLRGELYVIKADDIAMFEEDSELANLVVEPLLLTEEVLTEFGIEVEDDNPKSKAHYEGDLLFKLGNFEFTNTVVTATSKIRGWYCYDINYGNTIFRYAHELQNLYHSLYGKEIYKADIILEQEWFEDCESKNGWASHGWDEPEGYEIEEVLEQDKHYNPIKALFKYKQL